MKILFVVLPYLPEEHQNSISSKKRSFKNIPYGVMTIVAYIRQHFENTHQMHILDLNVDSGLSIEDHIANTMSKTSPDVVGISLMFDTSYSYIEQVSKQVKTLKSDAITLIGGSSVTMSYKEILTNQKNIDAVVYSEGEEPFKRFLKSKDKSKFLEDDISFITKRSLKNGKIPLPSKLKNLDSVVDIDYTMIDINDYKMEEAFSPFSSLSNKQDVKQFFLITSRGCPFKCTFCMHSAHDDKSMRYASTEKLMGHVKFMVSNYGMNTLTIYDDQILFNKKRAKEFFKQLAQFNLRVEMPNGVTASYIDEELAMLMKNAGMDTIQLAIESGSKYVIKELMNKPVNLDKVIKIVSYLRKYDFWIQAYFVNGMPGEMDEHRKETLNFINRIGFDWSGFSLAFPSMGSKLYEQCLDNGYINSDTSILTLDSTNDYVINNPNYSNEHIIKQTYLMNLEVNFVNNYRVRNKEYDIAEKAFRDVLKRYPQQAFATYYLGNILYKQGKKDEAKKWYSRLPNIISSDSIWREYFDHFNIDYTQVLDS